MDRRPASDLFNLGGLFKEIEFCQPDISNSDFFALIRNLLYRIGDYTDLKIETNIGPNSNFLSFFTDLNNSAENCPDDSVSFQLLAKLKTEIKHIEDYLVDELSRKSIAFPNSEFLDVHFLTWEPWNLFQRGQILSDIPDSIREDLILFCQCYAYGIYTSAIIHILKATENYNIHFCEKISNTKVSKSMHWGILIRETEKKLDALHLNHQGFKKLKESLEDLKKNNRIEIIHNNKIVLGEKEAFKIFGECKVVISKMYYILKDREFI